MPLSNHLAFSYYRWLDLQLKVEADVHKTPHASASLCFFSIKTPAVISLFSFSWVVDLFLNFLGYFTP
jgi:hypothetical protein